MTDKQILKLVQDTIGSTREEPIDIAVYCKLNNITDPIVIQQLYDEYDVRNLIINHDNTEILIKPEHKIEQSAKNYISHHPAEFSSGILSDAIGIDIDAIEALQDTRRANTTITRLLDFANSFDDFIHEIMNSNIYELARMLEDEYGFEYDGNIEFFRDTYFIYYR